jgi:hypothetical protein
MQIDAPYHHMHHLRHPASSIHGGAATIALADFNTTQATKRTHPLMRTKTLTQWHDVLTL